MIPMRSPQPRGPGRGRRPPRVPAGRGPPGARFRRSGHGPVTDGRPPGGPQAATGPGLAIIGGMIEPKGLKSAPEASGPHSYPKIELHVHLEGTVRAGTLLQIARRNGIALPADSEAGPAGLDEL